MFLLCFFNCNLIWLFADIFSIVFTTVPNNLQSQLKYFFLNFADPRLLNNRTWPKNKFSQYIYSQFIWPVGFRRAATSWYVQRRSSCIQASAYDSSIEKERCLYRQCPTLGSRSGQNILWRFSRRPFTSYTFAACCCLGFGHFMFLRPVSLLLYCTNWSGVP